jgi:hypothetical protein
MFCQENKKHKKTVKLGLFNYGNGALQGWTITAIIEFNDIMIGIRRQIMSFQILTPP